MKSLCRLLLLVCVMPTLCWAGQALHWPVHEYPAIDMVIGTYGDARINYSYSDVQFHPGVDLHQPGGTCVFAVKNNLEVELTLKVDPPFGRGWTYILKDDIGNRYKYGHVEILDSNPFWAGYVIPDTLTCFCTIWNPGDWDWSVPGWSDHLELQILDNALLPKTNPLWRFDGSEYLPSAAALGAQVEAVAYGLYESPNFCREAVGIDPRVCSDNTWYKQDSISKYGLIDVIVHATTGGSDGPVGICILRMAFDTNYSFPGWQHEIDLTGALPDDDHGKWTFGIEPESYVLSDREVPRTKSSTLDDEMWYVITSYNENGTFQRGGISYYGSVESMPGWVWIEATSHMNMTTTIQQEVRFVQQPTSRLKFFRAMEEPDGIALSWEVWGGSDIAGFTVCRGASGSECLSVIEGSWVPMGPERETGRLFSYLDMHAVAGECYTYGLDLMDNDGAWHRIECEIQVCPSYAGLESSKLAVAEPNPFRDAVTISLLTDSVRDGAVQMHVFDCSGRVVWSSRTEPDDGSIVKWGAVDNCGLKVAPGIYVLRVECGPRSEVTKLVYLK